jgi:hypothetical protein
LIKGGLKMPSQLNIEDAQNTAKHYGGKCLSKVYFNSGSPLKWMCKTGHTWEDSYRNVSGGKWCRQCAKNNSILEEIKKIAVLKGGQCLSDTYITGNTKLWFKCKNKHKFLQSPVSLRHNGRWCMLCYKSEKKEKALEKAKAYAKQKGGVCLSEKYINKNTKLKWQCSKGHVWLSIPHTIFSDHWCKLCNRSETDRKVLNQLHLLAKNKGGKCLSTSYSPHNNILKWKCKEGHEWQAPATYIKKGTWCRICTQKATNLKISFSIDELQKVAFERGGKLLSKEYINSRIPVQWQCKNGHTWFAPSTLVLTKKTWCIKCHTEKTKVPIETFIKIAEQRGGKLLSKKYINRNTKLKWKCAKGHVWDAKPFSVKNGSWCPKCFLEPDQSHLSELKSIAAKRKGKLLSKKYLGAEGKLKWQCSNKHIWWTTPHIIKRGSWCKQCYILSAY